MGIPRGNGQVARIQEIIINVPAKLTVEGPTKWYKYITSVQSIMNSICSRSTEFTPFELLTGVVKHGHQPDLRIKEILDEEHLNATMRERKIRKEIPKENILKIQKENRKHIAKKGKRSTSINTAT